MYNVSLSLIILIIYCLTSSLISSESTGAMDTQISGHKLESFEAKQVPQVLPSSPLTPLSSMVSQIKADIIDESFAHTAVKGRGRKKQVDLNVPLRRSTRLNGANDNL